MFFQFKSNSRDVLISSPGETEERNILIDVDRGPIPVGNGHRRPALPGDDFVWVAGFQTANGPYSHPDCLASS
jgi:hypothetical protein